MPETTTTPSTTDETGAATVNWNDPAGIPTTPVAPPGGLPVDPGIDFPSTPVAPPGEPPVDPGIDFPTFPIAPPGGLPVDPGNGFPPIWPDLPPFPFPGPGLPNLPLFGQVRFLNASTNGVNLDVLIDGQRVLSGSTFATVSTYLQVADGFHTVTVRETRGRLLYQQSLAFVAGEKVTLVILDTASAVTLSRVSDMGCSNLPSGYGCVRVANMSYSGSNFDVRMFNNQVAFSSVGYRQVTSYKQAASGSYTFFVTGSQVSFNVIGELPVLILSALTGGCSSCAVHNPLLTYSVNVRAGRSYTSYIIGNPWSNLFRVFTLED